VECLPRTSAARELAERFPTATLVTGVHVPVANAAMALHRGDARRALELLDPLKPYDRAPVAELWPVYLRGQAYLQLKDASAASLQFQNVLNNRGVAPQSQFYAMAHLGRARAATLLGQTDEARKAGTS
jgi:eukaryotic-like serine/threonine-protein kinase